MYKPSKKQEFLDALQQYPFIKYAAKKVGIDRSTAYRWIIDSFDFDSEVQATMRSGRRELCDDAEFALIKKIRKEEDMTAIKFFLENNSEHYSKKIINDVPPYGIFNLEESLETIRKIKKRSNKSSYL